jgi:hypothetical protein
MKTKHLLLLIFVPFILTSCLKDFLNDIANIASNATTQTIDVLDKAASDLNGNNENFVNIVEEAIGV